VLVVPVQATPNQNLQVQLDGQACTLDIYQEQYGLFMDVSASSMPESLYGTICQNLNRIVRDAYLGFTGDFTWFDTQGASDPVYWGIGSRFQLVYLEATDLASLGLAG
jgi:hypothetical protein